MSGTDSLSRGVFAFKGNRKGKKNHEKRSPGLHRKTESESWKLYQNCWRKAEEILSALQRKAFDAVLADVVDFVATRGSSFSEESEKIIPACALMTGINLPDHADFFRFLIKRIRSRTTPHVAFINSASVNSNLRLMIQLTVAQLVTSDTNSACDPDDENIVKRRDQVLLTLKIWYNNQYPSDDKSQRPALVIVIQDFEGFPSQLLQEFLCNLREYADCLPFVLVFGIATTIEAIHRSLPHNVTSVLDIRKFSGEPSSKLFSKLVANVLISNDDIPFKLGGKVFKLLFDTFLFHDFSVKNFLSAYKFCLVEHFLGGGGPCEKNPSVALGPLFKTEIEKLSSRELDVFRKLNSFRKFVEDDIISRSELLVDDEAFKKYLLESLEQLEAVTERYNLFIKILHSLTLDLPQRLLGKYYHTVYLKGLSQPIHQSHDYREVFQLMGLWERTELIRKLREFYSTLEEEGRKKLLPQMIIKVSDSLSEYIKRLEDLEGTREESNFSPSKRLKLDQQRHQKLNRSEWQESLKDKVREKKKEDSSVYESLRKEIFDFCHKTFKEFLKSPLTYTFHEVKFFDRVGAVRRHLIGDHRAAIQTALTYPGVYLENEILSKIGKEEVSRDLPDTCIAFKLYLECGKLINLYDWLQCWLSVVNEGKGEEEDAVDEKLQARFTQAVAELQFIGFIKPSKRKTDHVSRLTWGGCS